MPGVRLSRCRTSRCPSQGLGDKYRTGRRSCFPPELPPASLLCPATGWVQSSVPSAVLCGVDFRVCVDAGTPSWTCVDVSGARACHRAGALGACLATRVLETHRWQGCFRVRPRFSNHVSSTCHVLRTR